MITINRRQELEETIGGLIAFKSNMSGTDRERLNSTIRELAMEWHDYGYAKGLRDGEYLAKEREVSA